jgi:NAD+ diphosphatase
VVATNTFAGGDLDRLSHRRTDAAWLAERLADPASRAVAAGSEGVLVREDGERVVPAELPAAELARPAAPGHPPEPPETRPARPVDLVLLGGDARGAVFGADLDAVGVQRALAFAPGARVAGLREVAPRLAQADGGLLAAAVALLHWHREHPRCARCGNATAMGEGGWVRACPACGAIHHPRTDPVVIMLVVDRDRALLGRQAHWPPGRWSALAGFVEPGESLEEAVAREVAEEADVAVDEVAYRSSQPWPFPASLMLGFTARYAGGEAHARDGELEALGWFDRGELVGMRDGRDGRFLPPPDAIARRLVDEWLDAPAGATPVGATPVGATPAGATPEAPMPAGAAPEAPMPATSPLPGLFAVARLHAHADVPAWVPGDGFVAITRTRDELSIVCAQDAVPEDVRAERGYAALEVAGPLDPGLVGVLARLTAALARAGIPVFAVSTYDTDYLLVRAPDLGRAQAALAG